MNVLKPIIIADDQVLHRDDYALGVGRVVYIDTNMATATVDFGRNGERELSFEKLEVVPPEPPQGGHDTGFLRIRKRRNQ